MAISRIALEGLPHSEIFGSKPVCGSPKLIAAYHVLHRRPAPRHPPYALSSLTTTSTLLETSVVGFFNALQLLLRGSSVFNEPRRSPAAVEAAGRAPLQGSPAAGLEISSRLVELTGFEPATSALQGRRSP